MHPFGHIPKPNSLCRLVSCVLFCFVFVFFTFELIWCCWLCFLCRLRCHPAQNSVSILVYVYNYVQVDGYSYHMLNKARADLRWSSRLFTREGDGLKDTTLKAHSFPRKYSAHHLRSGQSCTRWIKRPPLHWVSLDFLCRVGVLFYPLCFKKIKKIKNK